MKKVTVTASANAGVHIQDVFPAEGTFTRDVPAGTTKSFFLTDGQYNHIRAQLDAMLNAGLLTSAYVNESEEGRTDKFLELKKVASTMTVRTGFGDYFVGLDGKPYFKTDGGVVYQLGLTAGSDPIVFIGTIAAAGDFPLVGVAKPGWLYLVTAPCTDPVTGTSVLKDDEIVWTGSAWELVGYTRKQKTLVVGDSPYAVLESDDLILVDSTTGAITVNIMAAAAHANKRIEIMDIGNNAGTNNITVQVAGVPFYTMDENSQYGAWESNGTAWVAVSDQARQDADATHRLGDGSDHADVAAATAAIAVLVDDHVRAKCAGLDIKTDESEKSGALDGSGLKHFIPTHIVLQVSATSGALNADGTVNVGTSADGSDIASALPLTGLTVLGATRQVPLSAATATILGNATLYANVEAAETGAGTLELDVYVLGHQF